MIATVEPMTI